MAVCDVISNRQFPGIKSVRILMLKEPCVWPIFCSHNIISGGIWDNRAWYNFVHTLFCLAQLGQINFEEFCIVLTGPLYRFLESYSGNDRKAFTSGCLSFKLKHTAYHLYHHKEV